MSKLTPRQRRRQKTRQAILETAQALINEKGPDGISIREIARRIDYSPAGLYEYFDSKDDLMAAVCADGMKELSLAFKQVPGDLPPAERLVELGLRYAEFARCHPDQFLMIFNTLPSSRTSVDQPVDQNTPYDILLKTVQAAIETGEFGITEEWAAEGIAYSLWALMHGRAMLELTFLRNFQTDFDSVHRWAMETFINGLKAG
jgi:AcrR family transcriptional regulator